MSPDKDIFTLLQQYITPAFHGSCFEISLEQLVFPFPLYWTSEADTPRLNAAVCVFVFASIRILALCLDEKKNLARWPHLQCV